MLLYVARFTTQRFTTQPSREGLAKSPAGDRGKKRLHTDTDAQERDEASIKRGTLSLHLHPSQSLYPLSLLSPPDWLFAWLIYEKLISRALAHREGCQHTPSRFVVTERIIGALSLNRARAFTTCENSPSRARNY